MTREVEVNVVHEHYYKEVATRAVVDKVCYALEYGEDNTYTRSIENVEKLQQNVAMEGRV